MPNVLPSNATVEVEGFYSYFQWVQEATDGIFMPSILFGLFIILFIMFKSFASNGKALLGSSFIIMIASIMLSTLGFLNPTYMYLSIVMVAISALLSYLEGTFE